MTFTHEFPFPFLEIHASKDGRDFHKRHVMADPTSLLSEDDRPRRAELRDTNSPCAAKVGC